MDLEPSALIQRTTLLPSEEIEEEPEVKEVEITHNKVHSDGVIVFTWEELRSQFTLNIWVDVFVGVNFFYLCYYAVTCCIFCSIYFLNIGLMIDNENERKLYDWYEVFSYLCLENLIYYIFCYRLVTRYRLVVSKRLLLALSLIALLNKLAYYIWACYGMRVYFQYVKGEYFSSDFNSMARSLIFLIILTFMDLIRAFLMLVAFIGFFCMVRHRARNNDGMNFNDRLGGSIEGDEGEQADRAPRRRGDALLQAEYLYREKYGFSTARHITKKFAQVVAPEGTDCSICCDTITLGTEMSCSGKHLYHFECIQLWLYKHRECPLCKIKVI